MLNGKPNAGSSPRPDANSTRDVYRDMLLRPPYARVRVTASVVPILSYRNYVLPEGKQRVLEEMMRKQAVEELERYHIDVVDDLTAPLLHAQVYVKDSGTTILTVYAMTVELKLEEMLLDPVTSLRVTAITWSKSNLLVEFESGIEEANIEDSEVSPR